MLNREVQAAVDLQRGPVARRDRLLDGRQLGLRLLLRQRHGLGRRRRPLVEHPLGRQAYRVAADDDHLDGAASAAHGAECCEPHVRTVLTVSSSSVCTYRNVARPPSRATGSLCGK